MEILNSIGNLQLVHAECHKTKTRKDKLIISIMKQVEKLTLPKKTIKNNEPGLVSIVRYIALIIILES